MKHALFLLTLSIMTAITAIIGFHSLWYDAEVDNYKRVWEWEGKYSYQRCFAESESLDQAYKDQLRFCQESWRRSQ